MLLPLVVLLSSLPAFADGKVTYKDPIGDDNGPGTYGYPKDPAYKKGSFDLTEVSIEKKGGKVEFRVTQNAALEDPWKTGAGFSTQMVFVFIDTDHAAGRGHTDGLPGLNVRFAPSSAWEKVVILSPLSPSRVAKEVETKASALKSDILVGARVKGSGRTISGTVDDTTLTGEPSDWGIQVVIQSSEPFPSGSDLLTRQVNEYDGQHRFGGGNDGDCDPHVIDLLAGSGNGDVSEKKAQYDMLKYECNADGSSKSRATLTMVRKVK